MWCAFITKLMSKLSRIWVMWAMLWYCDIVTRDKNGRTFQKKLIRVSIKVCEVSQLLGDLIKYWDQHSSSQCSIQLTGYYLSDLVVTSYDAVSTALLPEDVPGLVWSRAAADKWQAMHQKISSGKKRPPLAGKNCLTLMLLMHRTSSFCNLDLDVPSRLPKLLYCVECGGADIRWRLWRVWRVCGEELVGLINGSGPGLILLISGQWTQFHASS